MQHTTSYRAVPILLSGLIALAACQTPAGQPASTAAEPQSGGPVGATQTPGAAVAIRIGMTAPLTGSTADAGLAVQQGAMLAVDEINEVGGIAIEGQARPIELLVEDCQGDPATGVAAAERLLGQQGVDYLIGDAFHSSVTVAIMDLAAKYGVPIVSAEPVSDAITAKIEADPAKYEFFWKMNYGSDAYADSVYETVQSLVDSASFAPTTKRLFFVVEDTDYGQSNALAVTRRFEAAGWSAADTVAVPLGATDFTDALAELADSEADVLVSVFTAVDSGLALVRSFRQSDVRALHVAIYYPTASRFAPEAGDAAQGLLWAPLLFDPERDASQQAFAAKIRSAYGTEATMSHAYGYDAIQNAADVFVRAGSVAPAAVNAAIGGLDRLGLLTRYAFDPATHTVRTGTNYLVLPMAQIQDARSVAVWPPTIAVGSYQPQPWLAAP